MEQTKILAIVQAGGAGGRMDVLTLERANEEGFAHGNADELFRLRDDLRRADPDLVLVMSSDHV
jgi:ADP-glucose pyrophosphorylase